MSDTRHTRTPWRLDETRNLSSWCIMAGKAVIASCTFRGGNREEAKANAAFIVHAANLHGELVEALNKATNALRFVRHRDARWNDDDTVTPTIAELDALIKKAGKVRK